MKLKTYLHKWRGGGSGSPPRVSWDEVFWSWLGGFISVAALAWMQQQFFDGTTQTLLIASFGASAVLVCGTPRSPLAQPRNLIAGHLISALIGVGCYKLLFMWPELAAALAVASAIAAMHATRTLHPPGGATALIAVIGGENIHDLGWLYGLLPATLGPLILLVVGLLVNNLPAHRRYPEMWW